MQRIAIAPPLTAPYDGPYKVVARSGRVFKVLIKSKVETLTADRVKPAHMERTPENERTRQPKATPTLKPMALQPTAKIHEPRTVVVDKQSTTTSKPSRTGVCTKQNLSAQSPTRTKEKVPEVNQRGEKTEEQSNTKATLYKVPHARNAITSHANRRYQNIFTHSLTFEKRRVDSNPTKHKHRQSKR